MFRNAKGLRLALATLVLSAFGCGDNDDAPTPPTPIIDLDGAAYECDGALCLDAGAPSAVCGDGLVAIGVEECDDGNLAVGDGCSPLCTLEDCGDGIVGPGEECEPPGTLSCSPTCRRVLVNCGDGMVQAADGEQCDDANQTKGDGCHECRKECGDGRLDRDIGEECEPAYSPAICGMDCKRKPYCGDGRVTRETGEECDPSDGKTCVACKRVSTGTLDGGVLACVPRVVDAGAGSSTPTPNPITNGGFASSLAGWTAGPMVTAVHVPGEGSSAPGAASVKLSAAGGAVLRVDGIEQCVPLPAGASFGFEASYFTPVGQASGVRAFPVVLLYPSATCTGAPTRVNELASPLSSETGKWLRYTLPVDTSLPGAAAGATVSLSFKLGVLVPPGQTGSALWDEAVLRPGGLDLTCGNCAVDPGEDCDDGNRVGGDGCSQRCRKERCGNGVLDVGEECDDGAGMSFVGAGTCTPHCKRKTTCDACAVSSCRPQVDACLELPGVAEAGPGKGEGRAALCGRLRRCVQDSGCAGATAISTRATLAGAPGAYLENCYCGTSGRACGLSGAADGSCRAEVEAALETTDPSTVLQRVGGAYASYPIFAALRDLLTCERGSCAVACVKDPSCGNGVVQERTATFASTHKLDIDGQGKECSDALTPSGRGCSFEECDGGPGCDASCFLRRCGNGLRQEGEGCDDGNTMSGDGCSADCKPEFQCGDSVVADKFGEECDPPNSGRTCTRAEYEANKAGCGCGATCKWKGCGNGVVDPGEECDPPGVGSCGNDCKRVGLSACVSCMLLNTKGRDCPTKSWLEGSSDFDGFGCLTSKACLELLECRIQSKCQPLDTCYCGVEDAQRDMCESDSFVPAGPCKDQELAAYQEQFGELPRSNAYFIQSGFFEGAPPGKPATRVAANGLTTCLQEPELFAAELEASGVSQDMIRSCLAACSLSK